LVASNAEAVGAVRADRSLFSDDRTLFLAIIDELGWRYDGIRPADSPEARKEWVRFLLQNWGGKQEAPASGYSDVEAAIYGAEFVASLRHHVSNRTPAPEAAQMAAVAAGIAVRFYRDTVK